MKKVSILLILLTITMTIHIDELKDLMMLLSICLVFYLFGFYIIRKLIIILKERDSKMILLIFLMMNFSQD